MLNSKPRASVLRDSNLSICREWPTLVLALFTGLVLSSPVSAQSVTGTISGTVTDPNGAVVAGANITLANDQNRDKRDQITNDSGRFGFASVQPGVYTIKV